MDLRSDKSSTKYSTAFSHVPSSLAHARDHLNIDSRIVCQCSLRYVLAILSKNLYTKEINKIPSLDNKSRCNP